MLKNGEINLLNVHGLRQIAHCPPHFERVVFDLYVTEKTITDWLYENLEGRFYIGEVDTRSQKPNGKLMRQHCVAFELHEEASYFSLLLPQINSNDFDF